MRMTLFHRTSSRASISRCSSRMTTTMLLLFLVLVQNADTQSTDCPTYECLNDSVCQNSSKVDFVQHPWNLCYEKELERDGTHCQCKPGFTGLRCGTAYESCGDTDHKCYWGGKCLPGLEDIYGNTQMFCDCSEAKDENGTRYAGKYCENKAIDICDQANDVFCIRGGVCKQNFQNYPRRPCWCQDEELDGPHCEYYLGSVPECTLDCKNNGHCRHGLKTLAEAEQKFANFWADNQNYMYCECPEGFFGHLCEVSSVSCGVSNKCFNGGECVYLEDEEQPDDSKYVCDCSAADGSYAGLYCQDGASDYCEDRPGIENPWFCTNGGQCVTDDNNVQTCNCPANNFYYGPKCEYERKFDPQGQEDTNTEDYQNSNCNNSKCKNGGTCARGGKDIDKLEDFIRAFAASFKNHSQVTQNYDSDFEHCVCPPGWSGLYCDLQVASCGSDPSNEAPDNSDTSTLCFHGGSCDIDEDGNPICDCTTANTLTENYAGDFCEHVSTDICTESGTANGLAFCVNDGKCKEKVDGGDKKHPGCNCLLGWEGEHCEIALRLPDDVGNGNDDAVNPANDPAIFEQQQNKKIMVAVSLTLAGVVVLILIITIVQDRRHQKELDTGLMRHEEEEVDIHNFAAGEGEGYSDNANRTASHTFTPEGPAMMSGGNVLDGDVMDDVEII